MASRNDELLEWLKSATDQQVAETGTTRGYLRLIGYGHKTASPEIAARTEAATGGRVTRASLRSDWKTIWPEIAA